MTRETLTLEGFEEFKRTVDAGQPWRGIAVEDYQATDFTDDTCVVVYEAVKSPQVRLQLQLDSLRERLASNRADRERADHNCRSYLMLINQVKERAAEQGVELA